MSFVGKLQACIVSLRLCNLDHTLAIMWVPHTHFFFFPQWSFSYWQQLCNFLFVTCEANASIGKCIINFYVFFPCMVQCFGEGSHLLLVALLFIQSRDKALVCSTSLQLRNASKLRFVEIQSSSEDYPVRSQSLEVPFQLCKIPLHLLHMIQCAAAQTRIHSAKWCHTAAILKVLPLLWRSSYSQNNSYLNCPMSLTVKADHKLYSTKHKAAALNGGTLSPSISHSFEKQ